MLSKGDRELVEIECPECGLLVKAPAKEVEKGKVRCARGHEFAVMGLLGASGKPGPGGPY